MSRKLFSWRKRDLIAKSPSLRCFSDVTGAHAVLSSGPAAQAR